MRIPRVIHVPCIADLPEFELKPLQIPIEIPSAEHFPDGA